MKTIDTVLEALSWPIAVLFLGGKAKKSLALRLVFSVAGVFDLVLLVLSFQLAADLYRISVGSGLFFGFWAVGCAIIYLYGWRAYVHDCKGPSDKGKNPKSDSVTDQSRETIRVEPLTTRDVVDTLKRMERHGKKARAAWEQANRGSGSPFVLE